MKVIEERGKVIFRNKKYSFEYKDKILTLIPHTLKTIWEFDLSFLNIDVIKKKKEIVYGITSNNYQIAFVNVQLQETSGGVLKGYVPLCIKGRANVFSPLPEIKDFTSMTFYGDCINKFYKPNQIIKENNNNGIKYKDIKETYKTIKYKNDKLIFGVEIEEIHDTNDIPVRLYSFLRIEFGKKKNIKETIEYYQKVLALFQFINNRMYIDFSEIRLTSDLYSNEIIPNKIINIGTDFNFYTYIPSDINYDLPVCSVNYYQIKDHIVELLDTLNKTGGYRLHYPTSSSDTSYIDVDKYLKIASAFESWFDILNPKFKSNKDEIYNDIKNKTLNFIINEKDNTNSKGKKYLNTFYNTIDLLEGSLQEQIKYSYDSFKDCISNIEKRNRKYYNLNDKKTSDIILAFSNKRNKLAHGNISLISFTDEEIIGYVIVCKLIQCMIYSNSGYTLDEIRNFVDDKY